MAKKQKALLNRAVEFIARNAAHYFLRVQYRAAGLTISSEATFAVMLMCPKRDLSQPLHEKTQSPDSTSALLICYRGRNQS